MRIVWAQLLLAGTSIAVAGQSVPTKQATPPFSIAISTKTPVARVGSPVSIRFGSPTSPTMT